MHNHLYLIYDRLSNRYTDGFVSPNDLTALIRVRDAGLKATVFDLCRAGKLDIETGKIELCDLLRLKLLEENENPLDRIE